MKMPTGFAPISLDDYVELHVRANPGTNRAELIAQLEYAIDAYRRDIRCGCGAPIWIIGSAQSGLACFTCITGEAAPDDGDRLTKRSIQIARFPFSGRMVPEYELNEVREVIEGHIALFI